MAGVRRSPVRETVLMLIALGISVLWVGAPYGRTVDIMGSGVPQTFASTTLKLAREVLDDQRAVDIEAAIVPVVFLGLLAPLYPAWIALRLMSGRSRLAARRRWVWVVEGVVVVLLSPIGCFVAIFAVSVFIPGASGPLLFFPLWLLPGLAAGGGLAAIALGLGRRSRIARVILAAPTERCGA
ncbi:MAG TPA: hypothetical protein VGF34_20675 [Stellaceae bacterium]